MRYLTNIYCRGFLLLIVAFIMLCGCMKIEPSIPEGVGSEVVFSTPVLSNATKVSAYGELTKYPETEKFTVYAKYSPEDFVSWDDPNSVIYIDGIEVGYDDSVNGWTTKKGSSGQTYYWPNSGKLTFAAYSPSTCSGVTYGQQGLSITDFKVDSDPSKQYDLLYAPRAMNRTAGSMASGADYYGTDLNFKHALSCIEFKVRNGSNYAGSQIWVKNIRVINTYSQGDFQENIDTADESVYKASPGWTDQNGEAEYDVVASDLNQLVEEESEYLEGARSLLLMPQDFDHSGTHVKIRITYNDDGIDKTEDIDLVSGFDSDNDGVGDTYFNDGTDQIMGWKTGKKYTYTITFGKYKIFFTPSVTTWKDTYMPPIYI